MSVCVYAQLLQSCLTLYNAMDCSSPGSFLHLWDSPGKNTGVGCHALLQEIFLTQGLNPCLLHCRQILYPLSYLGSPKSVWGTLYLTPPLPPEGQNCPPPGERKVWRPRWAGGGKPSFKDQAPGQFQSAGKHPLHQRAKQDSSPALPHTGG